MVSLIIEDGAHHYDLRGAHPNDTKYVIEARRIEKLHISRWVTGFSFKKYKVFVPNKKQMNTLYFKTKINCIIKVICCYLRSKKQKTSPDCNSKRLTL